MMSSRRAVSGFAAAAAGAVLLTAHQGEGHCHMQFPISRQYAWSRDFYDFKFDNLEGAPYAYNAGGVKDVQDRAQAETRKSDLDAAGGGKKFPLYFMAKAENGNGNYLETNEIAKRHGVCGDPRLGRPEDKNVYSTPNSEWQPLEAFESGQEIEINIAMVYYHWGHFEFFLCDVIDLDDPDGVVTQECLNKHPLTRAENANDASAIDPSYKGRYYADPPCRKEEVAQTVSDNMPPSSYNIKMRYKLPDIKCDHCVLQMHYMTGTRCKHIGYNEFNPSSWNSKCASETKDWILTDMSICGEGASYPEEFWSCADITLTSGGVSAPERTAADDDDEEEVATDDDDTVNPTTAEGTCSNGLRGIEGFSNEGNIETCCPLECNQCGGQGCYRSGADAGYDNTVCCPNGIFESQGYCDYTGNAPCIMGSGGNTATTAGEGPTANDVNGVDVDIDTEPEFPELEGAVYLGCFQDMRMERTMKFAFANAKDLTNEECVSHCRMLNEAYAGTQNDYSCWCGSDSDKIARHGESDECGRACGGDKSQVCGGLLAVTTWATGLAPDE